MEMQHPATAADATKSDLPSRATGFVHVIVSAALAGGVAGIVAGGLGGRLAMRITAIMATAAEQGTLTDAEERVGEFSVDGTIGLMTFGGMLVGIFGGFAYAAAERWFRGLVAWRGLAFGAFLLATLGWVVIEGDNFDFSTLGSVSVNLAMFTAVYLLFGVLVAPLYDWFRAHLPRPALRASFFVVSPLYGLVGLLTLGSLGVVVSDSGDGTPFAALLPAYLVFVVALAGTVIGYGTGRFERLSDLRGRSRAMSAAVGTLALPLAVGIALDIDSLGEILRAAY